MNMQRLKTWLLKDHETILDCPGCHNKLFPVKAKVGITLTTHFDMEDFDRVIEAEPFATINIGPMCHLTDEEIDILMAQAQRWAQRIYDDAFKKQKVAA